MRCWMHWLFVHVSDAPVFDQIAGYLTTLDVLNVQKWSQKALFNAFLRAFGRSVFHHSWCKNKGSGFRDPGSDGRRGRGTKGTRDRKGTWGSWYFRTPPGEASEG